MRTSHGLRRVGALIAASSVLIGLLALAPAALAVGGSITTVTIAHPSYNPLPVGQVEDLVANLSPNPGSGTVTFYDVTGGGRAAMATVLVNVYSEARWTVPADYAPGAYQVVAEYDGNDTFAVADSDPYAFTVGLRKTATQVYVSGPTDASGTTAEQGDSLTIQAQVYDMDNYAPPPLTISGTVDILLDGVKIGSVAVPNGYGAFPVTGAGWTVGPHQITAAYNPGTYKDHTASVSTPWGITVNANSVRATASIQYSTFYPYKDGYRDTDAIKGYRSEPATVAIKISNSSAKLVRSAAIASGTGAWSFAWNGRTATGTALPAGKYTVRQVVTDGAGLSKTFTAYITISSKRLYTYAKTLTKTYSQRSAQGTYSVGWQFTLPSATIYKKLVFGVYASSLPTGGLGPQDFRKCGKASAWDLACANPVGPVGRGFKWWTITGSTTYNRSGTYVRLYAEAARRTDLKQGKVTVTYAILK